MRLYAIHQPHESLLMPDFNNIPSCSVTPRALQPLVMPQDHGPVIEPPLREYVHWAPNVAAQQDALQTAGVWERYSFPPNLGAIEFDSSDDEAPLGAHAHGAIPPGGFDRWVGTLKEEQESNNNEMFEIELTGLTNIAAPA
ncbi:MAG: hypothetical protein RSH52_32050, partial [Janthinobacterium sp.]